MDDLDLDHLRQWIGRTATTEDVIDSGLVERFDATLGAGSRPTGEAPLGIHWCLAPPAVAADEIGDDGHPKKGGFLPPVPLPRRMWAGGEIEFVEPLRQGDLVTRRSRIMDVAAKAGRTGALVFLTLEHESSTARGVAIRERQDIVYRDQPTRRQEPVAAPPDRREAAHRADVDATPVLLFRYSALTFNGHRIHYDRDYARDVEFYPGLVVHGPMQATLLMHFAQRLRQGRAPKRFSYRGVSPLFDGARFTLNATDKDGRMELWTAGADGGLAVSASAAW